MGRQSPSVSGCWKRWGGEVRVTEEDLKRIPKTAAVVDLARTDKRLLERYMGAARATQFLDQNSERGIGLGTAFDTAVQGVALNRFPTGLAN